MGKRDKTVELKLPPQLIGVHQDALSINATSFKIEQRPPLIMASCSSTNQAMEIDFEVGAGQEVVDYIVARSGGRNGRGGFLLEYEGKRFHCTVTTDGRPSPSWVEVSWKAGSSRQNDGHPASG